MSIKKISKIQPESFEFSKDNLLKLKRKLKNIQKIEKLVLFWLYCFWFKNKMIIGYHWLQLSM